MREGDPDLLAGPSTDSEAADALPHEDLNREEASELLTAVFGDFVDEPVEVLDGLEVERFHGDSVALIAPEGPGDQRALLTSSLPLRTDTDTGEKAPVSLDLERVNGDLHPENPLAEIKIPAELGEGISFTEVGVRVQLDQAPVDRAPSNIADSTAFYPNVALDSDFIVIPTQTGAETSVVLRSKASPTSHTYEMALPGGGQLQATPEGGAVVVKGDETLITVRPPTALDAQDEPVDVDMTVTGDSLVVRAYPDAKSEYPVLVDPIFESFNWSQTPVSSPEWILATESYPPFYGGWAANGGLGLYAYAGPIWAPPKQATANYYVPRFFSDYNNPAIQARPTSYIKEAILSDLSFTISENQPYYNHPYLQMGLWSEAHGWGVLGVRWGGEGPLTNPNYPYVFPNENDRLDLKNVAMGLSSFESQSRPRMVRVGRASVLIADRDLPGIGQIINPAGWVNNQFSTPIKYTATDTGLGVQYIKTTQPHQSNGKDWRLTSANCTGGPSSPCPRNVTHVSHPLNLDPSSMPQGIHQIPFRIEDPMKFEANGVGKVQVDHTSPRLALGGTLTEQATVGSQLAEYSLQYDTEDGEDATPMAGSPIGQPGTGAGQFQSPIGVAVDSDGNVYATDSGNRKIVHYDADGDFVRQIGTVGQGSGQINNPAGIALTPSGDIWVAEPESKRLQKFNSKGEFVRMITYAGSGSKLGFVQPWGVAVGPQGTLWVADHGANAVFHFSQEGVLLGANYGSRYGPEHGSYYAPDIRNPTSIAVDGAGNAWVASTGNHRVFKFDSQGKYLFEFGLQGSGPGQFLHPYGIAVTRSGNVLVADHLNNRVQLFEVDGTYLRQFGGAGTANTQFTNPTGVAVGPGNTAVIGDHYNKRLVRWQQVDQDPQSGVAELTIKVDGVIQKSLAPGCASKNCQIDGQWTLDADNYAPGQHTVQAIATDAVNLSTTRSMTIETHGDRTPPALTLSGSLTEQGSLGTTLPAYELQAHAADPAPPEERSSGIAAVSIKVDGKVIDSFAPGCASGGCQISRQRSISSESYSVGNHVVSVTTTDAAGRTQTKSLTFAISPDTTAPAIDAAGDFYNAPEGWVEQKQYDVNASATDPDGHGVTSLLLKIDGEPVGSLSQACVLGSCAAAFGAGSMLDLSGYDGGAHSAELVASDGAGNVRKRSWTLNLVPSGLVPAWEAESTLEAVDATADANTVGAATSDPEMDGAMAGLELDLAEEEIVAVGVAAPSGIDDAPGVSVTVGTLGEAALEPPCSDEPETPQSPEQPDIELSAEEEEALVEAASSGCSPSERPVGEPLVPIEISPAEISPQATATQIADGEAAAVSTNVLPSVDLVARPLYDGVQTFAAIRDSSAPRSYAWTVGLDEDQVLKKLDAQNAAVVYSDSGVIAFTITASRAHDAIGAEVPTSLMVDGNLLILQVDHRAAPFVYPVIGGAGWHGGIETYMIDMPPPVPSEEEPEAPEEPSEEEGVVYNDGGGIRVTAVGPPRPEPSGSALWNVQPLSKTPQVRNFKFTYCKPRKIAGTPFPPGAFGAPWNRSLPPIVSECANPEIGGVFWATSVHGKYHYKVHEWVLLRHDEFACKKWGEESVYFAEINCHRPQVGVVNGPIEAIGHWRFKPGKGEFGYAIMATCWTVFGEIYPRTPTASGDPYTRPMEVERTAVTQPKNCSWAR